MLSTMTRKTPAPRFGMMNHPALDPVAEIRKAKRLGFDYVDLTLEPPGAGVESFRLDAVRRALESTGLGIVGHTGWHLNAEAAYPEVRRGVGDSLLWAARHFASLGARIFTYHIHGACAKYIGLAHAIRSQAEVLKRVSGEASAMGLTLVLEHVSGGPEQFEILDGLFEKVPALGFHLDVGHANLAPGRENATAEFLGRYGDRLRHVHFSDNRGGHDDHLPLGVGTVNWSSVVGLLKRRRYAGTITLEVFTADEDYVTLSLEKARSWFPSRRGKASRRP